MLIAVAIKDRYERIKRRRNCKHNVIDEMLVDVGTRKIFWCAYCNKNLKF